MTEQEFRQELDTVVTKGLNTLDVGIVYGQLATIKQFVEVVYDLNVANHIQNMQAKQAEAKGSLVEDVATK
jgi:hypothetical protein